jgi:asparagine synthase (glutamine-hydrolysing)
MCGIAGFFQGEFDFTKDNIWQNKLDSMYSGLEARVPFADIRLVEYVYNLPWEYKCHDGISKSLLVSVGKDYWLRNCYYTL